MTIDKKQLKQLQEQMASSVKIPADGQGYRPGKGDLIITMDIQYQNDEAFAAAHLLRWPDEDFGVFGNAYTVDVPYVPGYFAFREGPILMNLLTDIKKDKGLKPDLILVDGHGTAHPRKFGLGSWLGVKCKIPTLGVGKETLVRYEGTLGEKAGDKLAIQMDEETVGYVLRTQDGIKPVFVSAGHLISQAAAIDVVMNLRGKYRQIEPIRKADQYARVLAKNRYEDI